MPFQTPVHPDLPRRKLNTTIALIMALTTAIAVQSVVAAPNQSATQTAYYQIRSQTLDKALVDFSLKSGIQVIADGKLTSGITSPGVTGRYSQEQALQKLLAGTGVTVQTNRNGTVTLEKEAVEPQSKETTLKTMTVVGDAVQDVNDPHNPDYHITNASTATKSDTPILETPYSVAVVSQQVIKDQKVIRVEDALTNVAGVQPRRLGCIFSQPNTFAQKCWVNDTNSRRFRRSC